MWSMWTFHSLPTSFLYKTLATWDYRSDLLAVVAFDSIHYWSHSYNMSLESPCLVNSWLRKPHCGGWTSVLLRTECVQRLVGPVTGYYNMYIMWKYTRLLFLPKWDQVRKWLIYCLNRGVTNCDFFLVHFRSIVIELGCPTKQKDSNCPLGRKWVNVIFATLNICLIVWTIILPLLYCVLDKMGVMLAVTA